MAHQKSASREKKITLCIIATVVLIAACTRSKDREARNTPHLDTVNPEKVMVGEPFQVQPNGKSALSVSGSNLRRGSRIRLNGEFLETTWANDATLTAIVPTERFADPGLYPLTVEDPEGRLSNAIPFVVLPNTGPAPVIRRLFPAGAPAGKPFNEQAGGVSALGIEGQNFLPGFVVEINGEPQTSMFGDAANGSAIVPKKFVDKPGALKVTVRNKDGKVSQPAILTITPAK